MKTKINTDGEVDCFRNNDLYLGCFVKVEISDTMYSWEFETYPEITLSSNDLSELLEILKKLK